MGKLKDKKVFCLITGGSQGIGRTIAVEMGKIFAPGSKIVLISRSESGMQSTKELVSKNITVETTAYDLSTPKLEDFSKMIQNSFAAGFEVALLVHNAGSEGSGKLTVNMDDLNEWQSYMALNLYSVTMLTTAFLNAIKGVPRIIVNITSLAALQPFKSLGYYCIGKASREMYMRALAEENPDLDILNYSPGPVDTEMITRVIKKSVDEDTKKSFETMKNTATLIKPKDTVSKMIKCLEQNEYKSGSRIDYFDP